MDDVVVAVFPAKVTLSPEDLAWAERVGRKRQTEAERQGWQMRHDDPSGNDGFRNNIMGCQAELAVCRFHKVEWAATVNTRNRVADVTLRGVGQNIPVEVRSQPHDKREHFLIVKPPDRDGPAKRVTLVFCNAPTFEILGWIVAHEARKLSEFYHASKRGDGKDSSIWKIPVDRLNRGPIE